MKIQKLILYLLIALPIAVAASNLSQSDKESLQESESAEQEDAELDDDGDRGFDPCLLNASLAICNKQ